MVMLLAKLVALKRAKPMLEFADIASCHATPVQKEGERPLQQLKRETKRDRESRRKREKRGEKGEESREKGEKGKEKREREEREEDNRGGSVIRRRGERMKVSREDVGVPKKSSNPLNAQCGCVSSYDVVVSAKGALAAVAPAVIKLP